MKFIFLALLLIVSHPCLAQIDLLKIASTKSSALLSTSANKDEVSKGLKEALVIGANKAVKNSSVKGGFYNNILIRIPFPDEAEKMKKTLKKAGMQSQIKEFEKSINSAAELASKEVLVIFVEAINAMNIKDALQILKGGSTAATSYLKKQNQ